MILTGNQIKRAKEQGYLDISEWDEKRLNTNSYNLRLADELLVYGNPIMYSDGIWYGPSTYILKDGTILEPGEITSGDNPVVQRKKNPIILDMKEEIETHTFKIPKEGFVLQPGTLYLARTMEYTKTYKYIPMLEGRPSVRRLGISVHSTADFSYIGYCGCWALGISCVQPVRIYPEVEICQIYYRTINQDKRLCEDYLIDNKCDRRTERVIHYGRDGYMENNIYF